MNEHLLPVFNIILEKLKQENIQFWVHGGIAIAGLKGQYLRENNDIDTFVLSENYERISNLLYNLCNNYDYWEIYSYKPVERKRPKLQIYINNKEIFSLMPVFKNEKDVEFIFPNGGSKNFPLDILFPVSRNLNGFEYNTVSDKYIKELFYNHYDLLLKRNYNGNHMVNYKIDKEYLDSLNIEEKLNPKN
jgi:hypothetical protein